jgi:flavin-dependent dehydrogenase
MSPAYLPPKHVQVLVIGGGPAGSYTASVLAQEGLDVALFEGLKFPRYHVGESLVASVRHCLRFIGADEKIGNHGFVRKPGAAVKFNQTKKEAYSNFVALDEKTNAWNVVRSQFDDLLLKHSGSLGAKVFESTRVKSLGFSPTDPSKPISATWIHTPSTHDGPDPKDSGVTGTTTFDYLVDASGRAGIISTGHLKNRHFNESLRNIAVWGYWKDVTTYAAGTPREGAPWFEGLTDESGWAWFIPLHDGTTSVGVVMNQKAFNKKVKSSGPDSTLVTRYRSHIELAPGLLKLIGNGVLTTKVSNEDGRVDPLVRSATDFSYSADQYAGNGYRLAGDAGAFIDPLLSSGVHLALTSGLSAAATICASIRGDCTEEEAGEWHTKRFSTSYTRFQVVVLSFYKQIIAQSANILADINEDNFDRAFGFLRPFLQGASDMGKMISETELQESLDFCANVFTSITPEQIQRNAERARVSKELLDKTEAATPSLLEEAMKVQNGAVQRGDEVAGVTASLKPAEAAAVDQMERIPEGHARDMLKDEYTVSILETEPLNGYTARLAKGHLGMTKVRAA